MAEWTKLIQESALTVAAALLPVLGVQLVLMVKAWLAKHGLQVSAQQQAKADYWTEQAVSFVRELAAAREKTGRPMTPKEALETATDFLLRNSGMTPQKALDQIHAILPQTTEGAAASLAKVLITGEAAIAIPFGVAAENSK